MRRLTSIVVVALVAAATGCGSSGEKAADKAGGPAGPVVLRLADPYDSTVADAAALQWIVRRVQAISNGAVRIRIVYNAAGQNRPDVEAEVARMVAAGRFDLGWIGARAWDGVGVKSFQALQAPFLIDDYALLDAVVKSPLTDRMMAGLRARGLTGLILVPDLLRHPIGIQRPLVSLADFQGARIRDIPSRATDALLKALGAVPVHIANADLDSALAQSRVDGEELAIVYGFGSIISGNVSFFPKVMTLFGNTRALDRLTARQREVWAKARSQLERKIFAPSENRFIRQICADKPGGHVVLASRDQLLELERAAQPVYAALERDAQTRATIAAIRRLKASLPAPAPIVAPAGCGIVRRAPPIAADIRRSRALNGTYRWVLKPKGSDPQVITAVLRDGTLVSTTGNPIDRAAYTVDGNRLSLRIGATLTDVFTFTRDHDGTLRLTPVLPMDPGDQFVWSSAPWRRVGPPTTLK